MSRTSKTAPSPLDARAREVVERLHTQNRHQFARSIWPLTREMVKAKFGTGNWDSTRTDSGKEMLADKMVALGPEKAALCHLLCRRIRARTVVEIGTSFGVSTIYLAAAVRDVGIDTGNDAGEDGLVIGTEHEPGKVEIAEKNLADAGVKDHAEILAGDLLETLPPRLAALADRDRPVDFVLMDIWIPMALPALELLIPHLRPGALVVCDNVVLAASDYAGYLDRVRNSGVFVSVTVPGQGGTEISMKV
ncbi:O-methyltransferase [Corynebacterium variabile]|uniref:O-methyltransferase n=1 Tax=Corynebacterium variabile TaxID=1727 RepID=UPI003A8F36AB